MRWGICNETFGERPHERVCDDVAAIGYTGLEIAPFTLGDTPTKHSHEARTRVRETAERAGLTVIGLHWLLAKTEGLHLTSADPTTRTRTSAYLSELARLCRDVGGSVMVLGSPQQRNLADGMTIEQGFAHAEAVLAAVVPTLEETGVTLALEPLGPVETNFLNTVAEAVALADRLASPHISVHLDVKALSSEAAPIPELITQFAARAAHFHANDPNRLGPGMGDVSVDAWMAALTTSSYEGWVSVEVFDLTPGADTIARQSLANLRQAFETVTAQVGRDRPATT